jgi:hypothetical protein
MAASYQKYDGASGSYEEVPGNGAAAAPKSKMKWILGAVAIAALGVVYAVTTQGGPSSDVMDKALAKSGIQVKSDGKVKLFDELSK